MKFPFARALVLWGRYNLLVSQKKYHNAAKLLDEIELLLQEKRE